MSTTPQSGRQEALALLGAPDVRAFLGDVERRLAADAGWSPGTVGRAARQTLDAGGKRLRPLLAHLCAPRAARGSLDVLRAAAAVELVHMATLVHDDVLDRAATRRGRPTVWSTDGDHVAGMTGDYLYARAFATLAETADAGALAELAATSHALAQGEAMQMLQLRHVETTPAAYLERCALKTGRLFACACSLGGRLGGLGDDDVAALADYGEKLGLAFQVADDLLDCGGTPETTGKPLGTDLVSGTITLPLLFAARTDVAVAAALAVPPEPWDVLPLLHRVAETGALDEAREVGNDLVRGAEAALERVRGDVDHGRLRAIARATVDRDA